MSSDARICTIQSQDLRDSAMDASGKDCLIGSCGRTDHVEKRPWQLRP
jgi:hypothetical protein